MHALYYNVHARMHVCISFFFYLFHPITGNLLHIIHYYTNPLTPERDARCFKVGESNTSSIRG